MRSLKNSIMILLKSLIPIAAASIFYETHTRFYTDIGNFYSKGYLLLAVLYGIIFFMFLRMYGGTKLETERRRNLILSCSIALVFTNFIAYIILALSALHFFNPTALILSMLVQLAVCIILYFILVFSVRVIYPPHKTIAISSGSEDDEYTIDRIKTCDPLHNVISVINAADLSNCTSYESVLADCDSVVVGTLCTELRAKLLSYCYTEGKEVVIIPSMQDILLNSSMQYIAGDKLLYVDRYQGFSTEDAFLKRTFDIVASLLGIIITGPIMAIVAICIKAYDKGPVFFKQKRLTRNGKEFSIIKFRSMIQDAEKDGGTFLVLDGDKRITPVGKFIRATRLDELPQFFNILKGDMSFVGPRPERPELYDIYCKSCPEFRYRLKVKAGLTGYAQVYGKYNTLAEDKVKLDLLYIEHASIMQDLQILMYTIKIIFVKDSTEGIKDIEKAAKK